MERTTTHFFFLNHGCWSSYIFDHGFKACNLSKSQIKNYFYYKIWKITSLQDTQNIYIFFMIKCIYLLMLRMMVQMKIGANLQFQSYDTLKFKYLLVFDDVQNFLTLYLCVVALQLNGIKTMILSITPDLNFLQFFLITIQNGKFYIIIIQFSSNRNHFLVFISSSSLSVFFFLFT